MATFKSFTEMEVWKIAREFSNEIFHLTLQGSFVKDFALKDQINRSSGSIMDNIAEGFERGGRKEFVNFLSYSKGSCGESLSQLYRALDRRHISLADFDSLKAKDEHLARMLTGFVRYLNSSHIEGNKFKDRLQSNHRSQITDHRSQITNHKSEII